jgi:hypothetical protein
MKKILELFLIFKFLPIIIILLILFVIGYFKFAKPVYEEHKADGYQMFETRWVDPETGKTIPKSELYNYKKNK